MVIIVAVLVAVAGTFAIVWFGLGEQRRQLADANAALQQRLEAGQQAQLHQTVDTVVSLAQQQLSAARGHDAQRLESTESRLGLQLEQMRGDLDQVGTLVRQLETNRAQQYGTLAEQLAETGRQTRALNETTHDLRQALSSSQARGQWGERMAEDVLQLAGFLEGVNYSKQQRLASGGIPDFTFLLPRGLELHMDVKFPLDNYLRYLDADNDTDGERFRKGFLRDARDRVRELADRGYREPDAAVDCVLLFIPNEALFGFIQEQDRGLVDEAMRRKIVLCSPLTLFAVLAVVRQSVDNFHLERTSDEILSHLSDFRNQWDKYCDEFDKLGTHLARSQKTYDALCATRRRQLERPLDKLDALRAEREDDPAALHSPTAGLRAVSSGS
ncbi:DNA recombination protein RmuC [soil metagenome]